MRIQQHNINNQLIGELISDTIIITSASEGKNIIADLYFQGFDKVVFYKENITPNFFDLKTGIAGEILQNCSNFKLKMAIVGDFKSNKNKRLEEFISESNRFGRITFVSTLSEALN